MSIRNKLIIAFIPLLMSAESTVAQYANTSNGQSPSGLTAALQAVIANNPSIKGKEAELRAQGYNLDTVKASRYPSMSVTANNISEQYDNQGTVRLDQPIYAFGKINARIDEAEAGYNVELWDLLRVQRQLVEEAAVAYSQIEGLLRRSQIARQNIEEHEELYERIERRQLGQLASEADVTIANSRLVQSRSSLERIQGEYQVALAELRALTLVNIPVQDPVDARFAMLPAEQNLQELALEESAELGLRREEIERVRREVDREKVDYLPTVYLRAEYDFLDQRLNTDPGRIGVALESDLDGFGFASRGRIKGAAARLDAADQQLSVSREEIRRQVSVLYANKVTQENLVRSQKAAIEASEATLASFIRQYETGRKSWVDVLNTQRELTNLRFELAEFETNLMIYSVRLQALTGGLDQMAGIESL